MLNCRRNHSNGDVMCYAFEYYEFLKWNYMWNQRQTRKICLESTENISSPPVIFAWRHVYLGMTHSIGIYHDNCIRSDGFLMFWMSIISIVYLLRVCFQHCGSLYAISVNYWKFLVHNLIILRNDCQIFDISSLIIKLMWCWAELS